MPYRFATEDLDYRDYASGRVIYNLPSAPAFPIRLASEIFQRARSILGLERRLAVYDPTCGGAYHLCALGFLHGESIASITASDIDDNVLGTARRNLGLLSQEGLAQRTREIAGLLAQYGKPSHAEALNSAALLKAQLDQTARSISTRVFQADALNPQSLQAGLAEQPLDLIISDIPYGNLSAWHKSENKTGADQPPLWRMLDALLPVLSAHTLLAVAGDKSQKTNHAGYQRVAQFGIGKRLITLLSSRN